MFDKEVCNIRRIFKLNGYPNDFIENGITKFENRSSGMEWTDAQADATVKPSQSTFQICDEKTAYMVLPYVGRCSQKFHRRIKDQMQQHGVGVLPAYQTTKVASYFSLKTKVPSLMKSNVVYKFVCSCDESTQYIGETERQFFQRVKDHTKTSNTAPSAVYDHIIQCAGCSKIKNIASLFSIVRQCKKKDILSHEATVCSKS